MSADREHGGEAPAEPAAAAEPASGPPAAADVSGGVPYADAEHHAGTWGPKVVAGVAVALAVIAYLRARR